MYIQAKLIFKDNLHYGSIHPTPAPASRLPRTRHSSREPTTTPPVRHRHRHQPQPPPGALRLDRINHVGLPPSARRIRHLNTACALPVCDDWAGYRRRPMGADGGLHRPLRRRRETSRYSTSPSLPCLLCQIEFPNSSYLATCCLLTSSLLQKLWAVYVYSHSHVPEHFSVHRTQGQVLFYFSYL